MKIFLRNTILFSFMIFVFVESISAIIYFSDLFLYKFPGFEVYQAIKKSKKKDSAKILILGDSVGRQLFNSEHEFDSINSLACNQAISVAGHYFLLHDYLEAGNRIEKLIFIYNPLSFRNNLDQVYTYHYFIKPFYNPSYYDLFTPIVKEQIKKVPYNIYAQLPHIKITPWAPKFQSPDIKDKNLLSPVSIEYLNKIKDLSVQYNFKLTLLPPPVNIIRKNEIEDLTPNLHESSELKEELEFYMSRITYLDSTEFIDGLHLLNPQVYINRFYAEMKR